MKKWIWGLSGAVGIFLVTIIVLPLVIQVDRYRPEIVKAINQNINGSVELGPLTFDLWGRINIRAQGIKVFDAEKKQVLSVDQALFYLPYTSVLSGAPRLTVALNEPKIELIKNVQGQLNVMTLIKKSSPDSHSTPANSTSKSPPDVPASQSQAQTLPALVANARLGFEIKDAQVTYIDHVTQFSQRLNKLNVRIEEASLVSKTRAEIWADLEAKMGTDLKVSGPLRFFADFDPKVVGGAVQSGTMNLSASADDVVIEKGDQFKKAKGIPARFEMSADLSANDIVLKSSMVKFHTFELGVSGRITSQQVLDLKLSMKPTSLKDWDQILPPLKGNTIEAKAKAQAEGKVTGSLLDPDVNLQFKITSPLFQLDALTNYRGRAQVKFNLTAKNLDLTPWMPKKTSGSGEDVAKAEQKPKETQVSGKGAGGAPDADQAVAQVRTNDFLKNFVMEGLIKIDGLKAENLVVDSFHAQIAFKNLVAQLSQMTVKVFQGTVTGQFSTDLKPQVPTYTMKLVAQGIDISKAVESQFTSLKNTLSGRANFNLEAGGMSFNPDLAKKRLQAKGQFTLNQARFKTLDVAKMANEAVGGSLDKVSEKVPFLKGKKLRAPEHGESVYDSVTADFTIAGGFFDMPNFLAKAAPKKGIDIKGSTRLGLVDESLDASWELVDVQRVTGADQLTVEIAGKTIKNPLAKSETDPLIFPIKVGCKMSAPCPKTTETATYLAGVAAGRLAGVGKDVAKEKAKDLIQGGLKKLFGR